MSALVHTGSNTLGVQPIEFSADQVNVIKSSFCPGFTEPEFAYCMEAAKSLGANPILRECHFLVQNFKDRNDKWQRKVTVQLGIDFYRKRAEETGRVLDRRIEWIDPEGNAYKILPAGKPLYAARCSFDVQGRTGPIEAVAYWAEFGDPSTKNNPVWRDKPRHMLAKVAEAHAIRVLCSGQLAGTQTDDEIDANGAITVEVKGDGKPAPGRALPAPVKSEQAQPEAGPSPDEAKRKVLAVTVKDLMGRCELGEDGKVSADKVKQTVSMMKDPGPMARVWPNFPQWSCEQIEELISIYEDMASEPDQAEDHEDAIEAEVSDPVTTEDGHAEPESSKPEHDPQEPESDPGSDAPKKKDCPF